MCLQPARSHIFVIRSNRIMILHFRGMVVCSSLRQTFRHAPKITKNALKDLVSVRDQQHIAYAQPERARQYTSVAMYYLDLKHRKSVFFCSVPSNSIGIEDLGWRRSYVNSLPNSFELFFECAQKILCGDITHFEVYYIAKGSVNCKVLLGNQRDGMAQTRKKQRYCKEKQ